MNKTLYENLIKLMPSKIIIDVSNEVRAILIKSDSDALSTIAPLIRSLAINGKYESLVAWAQQNCTPAIQTFNASNIEEFFLLDSLGEKIFTHLQQHRMYLGGCLPYCCDEVMLDGSLILARIDKFEDYEHYANI